MNNSIDSGSKAKSICAQAYTHVLVQGQYAERQYDELLKNFGQDKNAILFTCQMTKTFLKKLHDDIGNFMQEIEAVTLDLQGDLGTNIKTDQSPDKTQVLNDVADIKPAEIYRVETPTHHLDQNEEQQSEEVASKRNLSDALLEQFEALENLGNDSDDSMTIGSMSFVSSRSSSPMTVEDIPVNSKDKLPDDDIAGSESSCASDFVFSSQDYRDIYNIKPCFVILKTIDEIVVPNEKSVADTDKEGNEIERLLNWRTLETTKRQSQDDLLRPIKVSSIAKDKKSQQEVEKEQEKSDESDTSESVLDDENSQFPQTDFELRDRSNLNDITTDIDDQTAVANAALAALSSDLSSSDADTSSNDTTDIEKDLKPKKEKKRKKRKERRRSGEQDKDENAAWKADPLLRGRLSSDSDDEPKQKRTKVEQKDVNFDPSAEEEIKKVRTRAERCSISSISSTHSDVSRITVGSSSGSDSSDLEIISFTAGRNHHRRNIRAVNDEALTEETRRAVQEEEARIQRLKPKLEQMTQSISQEFEEIGLVLDADKVTEKPLVTVNRNLTRKLKDHQKMGVQFMWNNCYESLEMVEKSLGTGCILAHCMGLGKTLQVITLIHTLFKYPQTKTNYVVVVCPLSTVLNWAQEFKVALEEAKDDNVPIKVHLIKDKMSKMERYQSVRRFNKQKGVLIIGYDAFVSLVKDQKDSIEDDDRKFARNVLHNPGPDLVVCDEGHLIKNDTKQRAKMLAKIRTKRRIVLTGTPLQNNLKEYYQMVQFVKPNLLGTSKEFSNRFENPIKNGSYHDSLPEDIKLMQKRSHILFEYLKGTVQRFEVSELQSYLPNKTDYVLFVTLHPVQVNLYKNFLEKYTEATRKRMLADYMALRNVWTHPHMLHLKEQEKPKVKKPKDRDLIVVEPVVPDPANLPKDWYKQYCPEDIAAKIEYGPKLLVAFHIIEECEKLKDKLLIFSRSLLTLDTIEHFLRTRGTTHCPNWKPKVDYLRMDGNVAPDMRMEYIAQFTMKPSIRVFLISQEVGGMGINLVAANRVILMDVNFNPAVDSQSIFRVYRFGQTKKCYIYRLVAMGTMEEVNYERSVTKSAISARVVDEKQITRHYKADDLHRMYRFNVVTDEPRPVCKLPQDELLAAVMSKSKEEIYKYHEHQALLENRPEEQLNEEEQKLAWDEFKREQEIAQQMVVNRQFVANSSTVAFGSSSTTVINRQCITTNLAVLQAHNMLSHISADTPMTEWREQINRFIATNTLRYNNSNVNSTVSNSSNKSKHENGVGVKEVSSPSSSDALIVLNDDEVIETIPHKENLEPLPTTSVNLTQLDSGNTTVNSRTKPSKQISKNSGYHLNKPNSPAHVPKCLPQISTTKSLSKHIFNTETNTTAKSSGNITITRNDVIEIDLTE